MAKLGCVVRSDCHGGCDFKRVYENLPFIATYNKCVILDNVVESHLYNFQDFRKCDYGFVRTNLYPPRLDWYGFLRTRVNWKIYK